MPLYPKEDLDNLIRVLRLSGFEQYSPYEWVYETPRNRFVKVTINEGWDVTASFNDEKMLYLDPKVITKVLGEKVYDG